MSECSDNIDAPRARGQAIVDVLKCRDPEDDTNFFRYLHEFLFHTTAFIDFCAAEEILHKRIKDLISNFEMKWNISHSAYSLYGLCIPSHHSKELHGICSLICSMYLNTGIPRISALGRDNLGNMLVSMTVPLRSIGQIKEMRSESEEIDNARENHELIMRILRYLKAIDT